MRNASQLCRGLAQAAQSIERPYIPRHIPLPSSSYSAASPTTARASPSTQALNPGTNRPARAQRGDDLTRKTERLDATGGPLKRQQSLGAVGDKEAQHERSTPDTASPDKVDPNWPSPSQFESWEGLKDPKSTASIAKKGHLLQSHSATQRRHIRRSHASKRRSASTSTSKQLRLDSTQPRSDRASKHPPRPEPSASNGIAEQVKAAYPDLSDSEAGLLLQIFSQIESLRSQAASALISWYEDHVWTVERQSDGAQQIETPQSLSMLLRFAYQRNDLRSLLRVESRIARITSSIHRPHLQASPTKVTSTLPDSGYVDGVCIWPEPTERPNLLAFNLKVAFAARDGNWVKVEELLNQADLLSGMSSKLSHDRRKTREGHSTRVLSAIGWSSLLRFGLGNVQRLEHAGLSNNSGAETPTHDQPARKNESIASLEPTVALSGHEDDKAKKAMQDAQQMQAKLSVTKRLLPNLLRSSSGSSRGSRPTNTGPENAPGSSNTSATPAWLLHSVLTQLAERGETASVVKIAHLALSEDSFAANESAAARKEATHILNLALMACICNKKVLLNETLRVFNSLTGSRLGRGAIGSTVLNRPALLEDGSAPMPLHRPKHDSNVEQQTQSDIDQSSPQSGIIPNEESLVLLLKKVCHPLFRASWTRKLVDEFEQLFPKVKLSGRTFRVVVAKCIAPAPSAPTSSIAPEPVATEAAVVRAVAGGRRSRNRRKAAATLPSNALSKPHTSAAAPVPARGPKIKLTTLTHTLQTIITRFTPHDPTRRLHLSTTNRRRFEHTLSRAKRVLLAKRTTLTAVEGKQSPKSTQARAVGQIDTLLDLIPQVQRLGRCEDAHWKRYSRTRTSQPL